MTIASDHIGSQKNPSRLQLALDRVKQIFKFDNVMQRLVGNHHIVFIFRSPLIKVVLLELQVLGNANFRSELLAAFEHVWVYIQAHNMKIIVCFLKQALCHPRFHIAVSAADADNTNQTLFIFAMTSAV